MDPAIKELWIAALMSGAYKQGRSYLKKTWRGESEPSYCCLGVLCEILGEDQHVEDNGTVEFGSIDILGGSSATFMSLAMTVGTGVSVNTQKTLAKLNDGEGGVNHKTFNQIADYIHEEL